MNLEKLEQSVRDIVADLDRDEFIYQLLRAYDQPKASITRLKNGQYNQSKNDGEVLWKKKLCFRHEAEGDLHECIDRLKSDKKVTKHAPRFIIVTDFETLLALDTKTGDTISPPIQELADSFDFFLPWAGMEKSQIQSESLADIKAAEKMGRLYEMILVDNAVKTDEQRHALNIFLSRLLFCFFAEDTEIFGSDQFTNGIASHTAEDGGDLQGYLQKLFAVLATEDRKSFPEFLRKFPYVNGGLFCEDYAVPVFTRKSRKIIIECGSLNWKAINPDIFGSMIQAVVHSEERGQMGMHYTSVVNIMKVIEPLFLNELKEQLEKAGKNKKKLEALLNRLYSLRIFDPACGSGNFLIIAYKELCRLEIEIFNRLGRSGKAVQMDLFRSNLQLTQFYGIELDDFAHETAKLSLWLAEHQMNIEFKSEFGATRATLPLKDGGNIVCGNAINADWEDVCPTESEVLILGNPPYVGGKSQSKEQKNDMSIAFEGVKNYRQLDYIAAWFAKAANYVARNEARCAFVTTSSICQGTQVYQLWPFIFGRGVKIQFAHKPFKWVNNARGNAQVICSIIGLAKDTDHRKVFLFDKGKRAEVDFINAYLVKDIDAIVYPRTDPLSELPALITGNSPYDGGNLLLSTAEKTKLLATSPSAEKLLKRAHGSKDYLNGRERWCLWIKEEQLEFANAIPVVKDRIRETKKARENGGDVARGLAGRPYRFRYTHMPKKQSLIIPRHSAEQRHCIPIGFLKTDDVILDSAQAIYDPDPWIFAVVSSLIHTCWARVVGGKIKTDFRYLSGLVYNTFPLPKINEKERTGLEDHVFNVLDQREAYPELTLAALYDPDTMPASLREAHHQMDLAVERCYRKKPFSSDEERLEYLFKLYDSMIEEETTSA